MVQLIEGDNLYGDAHGQGTVNTIFAGDGADIIHLLGGDQQAGITGVYGDSIDFVSGESLDAYFGDVLELTWARDDVDISLYSGDGNGDMHRITYRGEGG